MTTLEKCGIVLSVLGIIALWLQLPLLAVIVFIPLVFIVIIGFLCMLSFLCKSRSDRNNNTTKRKEEYKEE
jgi:hypothetical protein